MRCQERRKYRKRQSKVKSKSFFFALVGVSRSVFFNISKRLTSILRAYLFFSCVQPSTNCNSLLPTTTKRTVTAAAAVVRSSVVCYSILVRYVPSPLCRICFVQCSRCAQHTRAQLKSWKGDIQRKGNTRKKYRRIHCHRRHTEFISIYSWIFPSVHCCVYSLIMSLKLFSYTCHTARVLGEAPPIRRRDFQRKLFRIVCVMFHKFIHFAKNGIQLFGPGQ